MILVVFLSIIATTLIFLAIIENTSLQYDWFTRVSPIIFMVVTLISVLFNYKIDVSNKTESVIYKNPKDAKVEIVSTHERELLTFTIGYDHTKITAGDTITQDKLDYLKETQIQLRLRFLKVKNQALGIMLTWNSKT